MAEIVTRHVEEVTLEPELRDPIVIESCLQIEEVTASWRA